MFCSFKKMIILSEGKDEIGFDEIILGKPNIKSIKEEVCFVIAQPLSYLFNKTVGQT